MSRAERARLMRLSQAPLAAARGVHRRRGRVVTETDSHTHGERARTISITPSLPTPEGPESTVRRAAGRASAAMCLPTAHFYPVRARIRS
jgi:hypothetical protein